MIRIKQKKRAKSKQGKKQYNVQIVEKPHIQPAMSAAPILAIISITTPTTTHPTRASTPWPSMVPASANMFVTGQWLMSPTQENGQAPPRQENVPVRTVTITILSVMEGLTSASNSTTTSVVQSPEITLHYLCPVSYMPFPSKPKLVRGKQILLPTSTKIHTQL